MLSTYHLALVPGVSYVNGHQIISGTSPNLDVAQIQNGRCHVGRTPLRQHSTPNGNKGCHAHPCAHHQDEEPPNLNTELGKNDRALIIMLIITNSPLPST